MKKNLLLLFLLLFAITSISAKSNDWKDVNTLQTTVKSTEKPITIRVKAPEEWTDTISFYHWNTDTGISEFVIATLANDGLYEHTFQTTLLNFIVVNGTSWTGYADDQTNDMMGVTTSTTYEIGGIDPLTYKRSIFNEPQILFSLPTYGFVDEPIYGEASSVFIENPVYSYSVQTPDATTTENITFPYTPTLAGTYLFSASVETTQGEVLTATATVAITEREPITIRVKVPEEWTDTISFFHWNSADGTSEFVTATLADDGLYEHTFQAVPINFIVLNGTTWSGINGNQTNDVLDVITSTTYEIGDIDPDTYKRTIHTEPQIFFNLPGLCYTDEPIYGEASSVFIENPEYKYSVQTPDSILIENITFPYTPTLAGTHLFVASVETAQGEVLTATAPVNVISLDSITIRVKVPEVWTDTISFYHWNPAEGTSEFVIATLADDGLYEHTFYPSDPLNFIVVNGTTWSHPHNQTTDVTDVIASSTYEIGEINPSTNTRYISNEPLIMFNLAGQYYLGDTIDGAATSLCIENPVYKYSVQTPSSDEMNETTLPYTPTEEGMHTFCASVETPSGDVLITYWSAMVSPVPDPITIRVKVPEEWNDTITFIYWNMYTNSYSVSANQAAEGLYEYTFERFCPLYFVVQNGKSWSPEPGSCTVTVMDITKSSTFEIGDIYSDDADPSTCNMRAITLIEDTSGEQNISQSKDVNIYSNTANQTIDISLNGNDTLYLVDMLGRVILSKEVFERALIDVSHLNTGIYLARVAGVTKKIIIK